MVLWSIITKVIFPIMNLKSKRWSSLFVVCFHFLNWVQFYISLSVTMFLVINFIFSSNNTLANLLNSRVVIKRAKWSSLFQLFVLGAAVLTKLLILGILFSIAVIFILNLALVTNLLWVYQSCYWVISLFN